MISIPSSLFWSFRLAVDYANGVKGIYLHPPIYESLEASTLNKSFQLTNILCPSRKWLWARWYGLWTSSRHIWRAWWTWRQNSGFLGRHPWRSGSWNPPLWSRWCGQTGIIYIMKLRAQYQTLSFKNKIPDHRHQNIELISQSHEV